MKLEVFNQRHQRSRRKGKPTVRVTRKGMFAFNRPAVKLMGLEDSEGMEMGRDEAGYWYAILSDRDVALPVKQGKQIQCSEAARELLDQIKTNLNTTFQIGREAKKLPDGRMAWPLIMASASPTWHANKVAEDCEI